MIRTKKPSNDAASVAFRKDCLIVTMKDGRAMSVPLVFHKPLLKASPAQRRKFEIFGGGFGIEWPELKYDVCVRQLLLAGASCCDD